MLKTRTILLFILLNLAITLPLAVVLNVWIDEAYTLDTTSLGPFHAWMEAIQFENQPPLYFVVLSLWRSLSDSIFFARLFSVLCISLTVASAPLLSRRYLPKLDPRWFMLAVAVNPYSIWAALEIRTYAFAILLSALLLLVFWDGFLRERPRQVCRYGYGILAIAALYTNYLLAALLIAQVVTLLVMRYYHALKTQLLILTLVALAFVPMLWPLAEQVLSQTSAFGPQESSLLGTLKAVNGRVLLYAIPSDFNWGWPALWDGLRYGALALGIGVGVRRWRYQPKEFIAISSLFAVSFVSLTLVLDLTEHARMVERYGYPLFLPTLLLMLALFSLLRESPQRQRYLRIWSLLTVGLCVVSLFNTYAPLAKDGGDWRSVAAHLEASEVADQPIVVFSAEGALPLKYHYHGKNPILPLPPPPPDSGYNLHNLVLQDEAEVAAVFAVGDQAAVGLPEEFWLVQAPLHMVVDSEENRCEIWNIDLNCQALQDFVEIHYNVVEQVGFYDAQLQRLHRKPSVLSQSPSGEQSTLGEAEVVLDTAMRKSDKSF